MARGSRDLYVPLAAPPNAPKEEFAVRVGRIARALLASSVAAACVAAAAAPVIAGSGALTITASTTLTEDQAGPITVAANGITLDCAGHTVSGPGWIGIYLPNRTGVT